MQISRPIGLFLLVVGCLPACAEKPAPPPPPPVDVLYVEVGQRDVPVTLEAVGQTGGSSNVEIRSRVTGYLQSTRFQDGDTVEKGQVLYVIDPRPYEAALARARGDVAQAQADVGRAQQDVNRLEPLVKENAVPRQDYETSLSLLQAAQARLQSAQALEESARIDLDFTTIRSPVSGLAGESLLSEGNLVAPGESLLTTISVIDPIRARFSLSEQDYLMVVRAKLAGALPTQDESGGAFQMVLADGTVHPQPGRFAFAERRVDPRTGTLLMEAEFANPDQIVRPGQFARVIARIDTRKGAPVIPQRAVRELQSTFQVAVIGGDDTIEIRTVKPAFRLGGDWVIDEGLAPGERVVVEGLQKVRAGSRVKPAPMPAADAPAGG